MQKIKFTKMVASGNDFVVLGFSGSRVLGLAKLAQKICDRKYGVGADGMLVLEKSKRADIRMRIFNADGSQAEMCGNGARCAALYLGKSRADLATKAGIIRAQFKGDNIRIKLTDPKNIRLDLPIKVNGRRLRVNFIDTGVPHAVIFVEGLKKIDVFNLGRVIRYHKQFAPRGTNVDFVEVAAKDTVDIRTYERGVEDETLACGTGSTAAALIFALKSGISEKVFLRTRSGETLSVYFKKKDKNFSDVWLEGKAGVAFNGEFTY